MNLVNKRNTNNKLITLFPTVSKYFYLFIHCQFWNLFKIKYSVRIHFISEFYFSVELIIIVTSERPIVYKGINPNYGFNSSCQIAFTCIQSNILLTPATDFSYVISCIARSSVSGAVYKQLIYWRPHYLRL